MRTKYYLTQLVTSVYCKGNDMAIRLKIKHPDGSVVEVEADSIDEAIEYQRKWFASKGKPMGPTPARPPDTDKLSETSQAFILCLESYEDGIETRTCSVLPGEIW